VLRLNSNAGVATIAIAQGYRSHQVMKESEMSISGPDSPDPEADQVIPADWTSAVDHHERESLERMVLPVFA
jgi:hypothetical protein